MTANRFTTLYTNIKARLSRTDVGEVRDIGRGSDWLMVLGGTALIALALVGVGALQYFHTREFTDTQDQRRETEFARERELLTRVQGLYEERRARYTEVTREEVPSMLESTTPPIAEDSPEPPTTESATVELAP